MHFFPAVMFGLERGNNDLLMFFMLASALPLSRRCPRLALLPILIAGFLKLFPFFGLALLLREERRFFFRRTAICAVVVILYIVLTLGDIQTIREVPPQETRMSYGMNIFQRSFAAHFSQSLVARLLSIVSYVAVAGIFIGASKLWRSGCRNYGAAENPHIDAFRIGSTVYIGSFLLLSNWDYRLMFLLFTLPALFQWACEATGSTRWVARISLTAIVLSCWSLGIRGVALHYPSSLPLCFVVDQAAKWTVFGGLLCAFASSLPAWLHRGKKIARSHG